MFHGLPDYGVWVLIFGFSFSAEISHSFSPFSRVIFYNPYNHYRILWLSWKQDCDEIQKFKDN